MALSQRLELRQTQGLVMTPQLMQAIKLLQLSSLDLAAYVEAELWPDGPVCPHCGGVERNKKMGGTSTRIGTYKCYDCRKPFTVKIGTIFEASHVPMRLWLQAMYLIAGSKKGISSNHNAAMPPVFCTFAIA